MTKLPLAQDQNALALMHALPILPIPAAGSSPAIDAMNEKSSANCFLIGWNGVFAWTLRPWIRAIIPLSGELPLHGIYGRVDVKRQGSIALRCNMIPGELLDEIAEHFRASLPNEAGAFILWNSTTNAFRVVYPHVIEATPSRLHYETVRPEPDEHIVADIHSHGHSQPYWSPTDDRDDAHQTVFSVVIGNLKRTEKTGNYTVRFCSRGVYHTLSLSIFTKTETLTFQGNKKESPVSFYVPETP